MKTWLIFDKVPNFRSQVYTDMINIISIIFEVFMSLEIDNFSYSPILENIATNKMQWISQHTIEIEFFLVIKKVINSFLYNFYYLQKSYKEFNDSSLFFKNVVISDIEVLMKKVFLFVKTCRENLVFTYVNICT